LDADLALERKALAHFRRLLELDTRDRGALDSEIASLEPDLAVRVQRLFERHRSETGRLQRSWQQSAATDELPSRLGAFSLARELGRGGMGIVAEGQREAEGFTQRVAIKWIPAWQVDAARRQRFLFERDVVSRLRHPHIAQLVDGGEGEQGELWYAMELVEGQDLLSHCAQRKLDLRARVRLLLDLCDAVAYAHRNLILHRDIKPSNVLVDGEGRLKLIDFGIAKGLDDDTDALTLDQAPMTPRYAAPEQLRGERPTTATDLWQIAAVAFELLAGVPARKEGQLRRVSVAALEADPEHAASCDLDQQRLQKALRGDLDAILTKALREEPEQRYANVESLAGDLRAWLQGQPVAVRRHERWYAARRFVSVHRWAVGFAGVAGLSVLVGAGAALMFAGRAREQAEAAERTSEVLLNVFLERPSNSYTLSSMNLIEFFGRVIEVSIEAKDLPASTRLRLLTTLAKRGMEIGAGDASIRAAEEAANLAVLAHGVHSIEAARALDQQARLTLFHRGPAAAAEMEKLLEASERIHTAQTDPSTDDRLTHLRARMMLADASEDMEAMLEHARHASRLADDATEVGMDVKLHYRAELAAVNSIAGNSAEAMRVGDAALEMIEDALERTPTEELLEQRKWIARTACEMRARAGSESALPLCQRLLSELQEADSVESSTGAEVLFALALAHSKLEQPEQALKLFHRNIEVLSAMGSSGDFSVEINRALTGVGRQAYKLGRFAEAADAQRQALEFFVNRRGASHARALEIRMELVESLLAQGLTHEARRWMEPPLDTSSLSEAAGARWAALWSRTVPSPSPLHRPAPHTPAIPRTEQSAVQP